MAGLCTVRVHDDRCSMQSDFKCHTGTLLASMRWVVAELGVRKPASLQHLSQCHACTHAPAGTSAPI